MDELEEHKKHDDEVFSLKKIIDEQKKEIFQLKSIFDRLPGDVYWKDKNGVWLGVNATGRDHLQKMGFIQEMDQVIGKTDVELFGKETADRFRENDREVMQSGFSTVKEEVAFLPTGERVVQLSTKCPLRDKNENIVGVLGITLNITAQKRLEQDLIETKASESRFKAMSAMGGMIAHELRTPLVRNMYETTFTISVK
ncbi:MAG: hypothetical protein A3F10_05350 [Coxiella sp. RIFCSPHIGHO2_12_FULL_42_15]|nr:MAG: hypothetical protein A3F10_05350 [Coxiella sp. RIFCSPHIGHO2_12_FULL_42_15]